MSAKDLPFTGERFVPGQGGPQILYEHVHRYLLAQPLAAGRRVLDLACGAGYGSFFLAQRAARVVGLDLDPGALAHAAATYERPNLFFVGGSADRFPFRPAAFDLVVAFEIIEHIAAQEAMLEEVTRVLHPAGLALISTPNKAVYSDARRYANPFHVREFYITEFAGLLRRYFPHVLLLGQKLSAGSLIWSLDAGGGDPADVPDGRLHTITAHVGRPDIDLRASAEDPMYVVALCSSAPLSLPQPFCPAGLLDTTDAYLEELREQGRWAQGLAEELKEKDQLILKLQAEVEALSTWGTRLAAESEAKDATILRLQKEFDERTQWALELDARCRERDKELEAIRRTRTYRAFRKLGTLP